MNKPELLRPPYVVYLTVTYMRECISDQDRIPEGQSYFKYAERDQIRHTFGEVYSFMRDRFRSIMQDLIIINESVNVHHIRSIEEISRFLIISYHDGFQ